MQGLRAIHSAYWRAWLPAALLFGLAGCTIGTTTRTLPQAGIIDAGHGYRPANLTPAPGMGRALPGTYVVLAFSGGGTRAAALAHGALRELEATGAPGSGLTLLDGVDMISSTSGGSVAAANYVVHGRGGYHQIETGFLRHNGMSELIGGVLFPPNALHYSLTSDSRIELLSRMFRRQGLREVTYGDLLAKPAGRPVLLLNAADIGSGERFGFTQRQLDLLCLDLAQVQVADAVAASAAFPVALTPLPLPNHSPCPAQATPEGRKVVNSALRATGGLATQRRAACEANSNRLDLDRLPENARALRRAPLLNLDPCTETPMAVDDGRRIRMVHLVDGGVVDNLGLDEPLATLSGFGDDARVKDALDEGRVRHIVILAVNARSQSADRPGARGSTPGELTVLLNVIGGAIDSRSGGLSAQLGVLEELLHHRYGEGSRRPDGRRRTPQEAVRVTLLPVDFELIADPRCRVAFQDLGTNWSLAGREVDALQEMASAMLRSAPRYLALVGRPGEEAWGQARAARACERLNEPEDSLSAPAFGGPPPPLAAPEVTYPRASSRG